MEILFFNLTLKLYGHSKYLKSLVKGKIICTATFLFKWSLANLGFTV